ncbi:MAG: chemotaxis protein CheW [Bacteroidales bacterium]|nr:chemotaxis protein CheW [Bacteroidales bacterium]
MSTPPQDEPGNDLYLQYQVGNEHFASAITDVFLIMNSFSIIRVPGSPASMVGAINYGNMILPVVNMRLKLGMWPGKAQSEDHTILIMELNRNLLRTGRMHMGVLVDRVSTIHKISRSSIEPPCHNTFPLFPNLIQGLVHTEELTLKIPDTGNLFEKEELSGMLKACEKL